MSQLQHKPDSKRSPEERRARAAKRVLKEAKQQGAQAWVNANVKNLADVKSVLVYLLEAAEK